MIKQILGSIILYRDHIVFINSLGTLSGSMWKVVPRGQGPNLKNLKNHILNALKDLQGLNCAYCGLDLYETSAPEIEHIAPKGKRRDGSDLYPQFMFTPNNLVLACHLCNSFSKKGIFDTVINVDTNYDNCTFLIVHPYFDNPDNHFSWVVNSNRIIIQGLSPKGHESIRIFELNLEAQTIARAKKVARDSYQISQTDLGRFQAALNYRL